MSTEKVFKLLTANKFVCFIHFYNLVALRSNSYLNTEPLFIKMFLNKKKNMSLYTKDHHLHTYCELLMSIFSICTGRCEWELSWWQGGRTAPNEVPSCLWENMQWTIPPQAKHEASCNSQNKLRSGKTSRKMKPRPDKRRMCPSTLDWASAGLGDCCHWAKCNYWVTTEPGRKSGASLRSSNSKSSLNNQLKRNLSQTILKGIICF